MISHTRTFVLGILISIIPFLGFPSTWRTFFIVLAALGVVFSSIDISFLTEKPIIKKPKSKEKELMPYSGVLDEVPQTDFVQKYTPPARVSRPVPPSVNPQPIAQSSIVASSRKTRKPSSPRVSRLTRPEAQQVPPPQDLLDSLLDDKMRE